MRTTVIIQNLKCDSCKKAVLQELQSAVGISNPEIDISTSEVTFEYTSHNAIEGLRTALANLGYPITGDPNSLITKVKSVYQCAIGKIGIF